MRVRGFSMAGPVHVREGQGDANLGTMQMAFRGRGKSGAGQKLHLSQGWTGGTMPQKFLLHYWVADRAERGLQAHFPAHRARLQQFHDQGDLEGAGPVGVPPTGAPGIVNSRAGVVVFVAGDPFVVQGYVADHRIEEWNPAFM